MKEVAKRVLEILEEKNYEIFITTGCFDIAAKRRGLLLFLKILKNIDGFLPEHANSLKSICFMLDAYPFLIGENTNCERLVTGVVYERFEIPAMNAETFALVLESKIPEIWRDKGGRYAEIDPLKLKAARKEKGLTQKKLARLAGVTQKTIYMHEKMRKRAPLEVVERLESVLERRIRTQTSVFKKFSSHFSSGGLKKFERYVEKKLRNLGFDVSLLKRAPCDAVAKEEKLVASEIEESRKRLEYRAKRFEEFLRFLNCRGVVITNKFKVELSVPVIEKSELEKISSRQEFFEILEKF